MSDEKKINIQESKYSLTSKQTIEISKKAINQLIFNFENEDLPRFLLELKKWEPLTFLKACLADPINFNPLYAAALINKVELFQATLTWLTISHNGSENILLEIKSKFKELCLLKYPKTDPYLINILTTAWRNSEKIFDIIIQTQLFSEQYIELIKQRIPQLSQKKSDHKIQKLGIITKGVSGFSSEITPFMQIARSNTTPIPVAAPVPMAVPATVPVSTPVPARAGFFEYTNPLESLRGLDRMLKNMQEIPAIKESELDYIEELVQKLREVIADLPDKKKLSGSYMKTIAKILHIGDWLPNPPDTALFLDDEAFKPIEALYNCKSPRQEDEIGNILFDLQVTMLAILERCSAPFNAEKINDRVLYSH